MKPIPVAGLPALLLPVLVLSFPSAGLADDPPTAMERLQLTASASRPVIPDRLLLRLYAEAEGPRPDRLADEVNRRIRKAAERARRERGVKVETGGYQTSPIHRNQRREGWRVRQTILLRGPDLANLARLLGRLQEELVLEGMTWEISPQRREEILAELRGEAVARFRGKAQAMATAFGYRGYRLVQATLSDGVGKPPPVPYRAMAMRAEAVQAPVLVPGEHPLSVTINGTVQLLHSRTKDP